MTQVGWQRQQATGEGQLKNIEALDFVEPADSRTHCPFRTCR